ncbi:MAG: DnaD domain protein, partial [Oscillospiraceae bacterium]
IDWAEKEIDTLSKAEDYIMMLENQNECEYKIKNIFGIKGRALTTKEREFAVNWVCNLNIQDELLSEAFDRCVQNTGKLSFSYMNKIIISWCEKGYLNLHQVLSYEKNSNLSKVKNDDYMQMVNHIYEEDDFNEV